jgi:hypothetical protein
MGRANARPMTGSASSAAPMHQGGGLRFANPPYDWYQSVELELERFNHRRPECNVGGKGLAECFGI